MAGGWISGRAFATGFYGPREYLGQGARAFTGSPEFYWDLEVKRLAQDFQPPARHRLQTSVSEKDADASDFAEALASGAIKPSDPATATAQHAAVRAVIAATDPAATAGLPGEFDSEFSDYDRGAFAYHRGKEHWDEAKAAWEKLLARPPAERRYRSTWAAYMLGKIAMKRSEPDAARWFAQTRALADEGFVDSLGLAADSYGWEARCEWKAGHPEKAAPLYLTQLALGDNTAVISLKALIPDRGPVDGMLNFGPEQEELRAMSADALSRREEANLAALRLAATDPLLRRLVTSHILATESNRADYYTPDDILRSQRRCSRWLQMIRDAKAGKLADAEYLGWIAYANGDYRQAAEWLQLAPRDSPASLWLNAKLLLRAGKMAEAEQSLAKGWEILKDPGAYTKWSTSEKVDLDDSDGNQSDRWAFNQSAGGDLATIRLVRANFLEAFDTYLTTGLWLDAAYVAERLLTAEELKKYVDAHPGTTEELNRLRYLLGRRLVRDGRFAEAAPYLPAPYAEILGQYVKATQDGANGKLPARERARAWFNAAWLARYDGMELMGTEVAPDGFISGGAFEDSKIAQDRLAGKFTHTVYREQREETKTETIVPKPSAQERERILRHKIRPDVRFHYRALAADLAMRAAQLLPDNSEELADVINTAGLWVKDRQEPTADRYFETLRRRAPQTAIGRAALARKWFVNESGPWSTAAETEYKSTHPLKEEN